MELKDLIATFQRWVWLLVLGLLVGLLAGFLASKFIRPVFEASTKIMISREIQNENTDLAGLNSQQLVQTYVQILNTKPLLDETSKRVGVEIDPNNVSIQQVLDTQIIDIKVEDYDPENAALIANTMVQVLDEQNEETQTGQYTALENRLTTQLEQVKKQIDTLEAEYNQGYEIDYQDQMRKVDEQITNTKSEISTLQAEIAALNPNYKTEDKVLVAEKQAQVQQLQSMYNIYEQIRANLLILGRPSQTGTSEIPPSKQQLLSTIELYRNLYLTYTEDLENAKLARVQQTPTIVQIEAAFVPEKPIRPISSLYIALSGMVGIMIAIGIVFFSEALRDNSPFIKEPIQAGSEKKANEQIPEKKRRTRTEKAM